MVLGKRSDFLRGRTIVLCDMVLSHEWLLTMVLCCAESVTFFFYFCNTLRGAILLEAQLKRLKPGAPCIRTNIERHVSGCTTPWLLQTMCMHCTLPGCCCEPATVATALGPENPSATGHAALVLIKKLQQAACKGRPTHAQPARNAHPSAAHTAAC